MRKLLIVLTALGLGASGWAQPAPDPQALLACARANWVADTFHGVLAIQLFRPEFSKAFRLEVWTAEDNAQAMIRVLAPEDEAGSGYLMDGEALWFYTPAAGQAVPLPSASLSASFLGSDLAVEDVFRDTLNERFTPEWLGVRDDETHGSVHRLRLVPRPDADVVFGRIELEVRAADCAVLRMEFYDQRDTLIRESVLSEFVARAGRVIPTRVVVHDLRQEGSFTEEVVESFEVGIEIPPERFTLACLEDESQCGSS